MTDCKTEHCGSSCEWIFERVRVSPLIRGGTRVEWELHPRFADSPPYTFTLQFGRTSNPEADDWTDIGDPVTETYQLTDSEQRVFGKFQWGHYRIKLESYRGIYYSKPQHMLGNLSKGDWQKTKAIIREEEVRLRSIAGDNGYLLKRRLFGEACECVDGVTGEIRNPQCQLCFGTGISMGYYAPYPCFYAELSSTSHRSHMDANRGTADDLPVVSARMLNVPQVFSYDCWVEKDTDFRWMIHTVSSAVEYKGTPLVLDPVELRLLPYTHPVYQIEITDQLG